MPDSLHDVQPIVQCTEAMIRPLPDREQFEREVRDLLDDGDITSMSGYLMTKRTNISKEFSPNVPDCPSSFFRTLQRLWAFDAIGKGQADKVLGIITRERSMWLPAGVVQTEPGKTTSKIVKEVSDLIEKEMGGASDEVLISEAQDIKAAVDVKLMEILARRQARLGGLRVAS